MSTTRRTRRPRRDTEPFRRSAIKSVATLVALAAAIYVGIVSYNGVPGKSYATLYAELPEIGNLIGHDPVRIAGVRVGQVVRTDVDASGDARVELQLDNGTEVPSDSVVKVRANGLLGARYVQLIPGVSRKLLANGATIQGQPDAVSLGVPDALDTLDAPTRAGLGQTVDAFGTGVLGHGSALNTALRHGAPATYRFTGIMRALLAPGAHSDRLVPSLNTLLGPLDASRADLGALLDPATVGLRPLVDQRTALRSALDAAPPALGSATSGLARGRALLASVRALSTAVNRTLPTVPGGLRATTALLRSNDANLSRARALLETARTAVPAALRMVHALKPNLRPIRTLLDNLDPMVRYIGPRACDIENFGVVMRSMTGYGGVGTGPVGPSMEFRAQLVPAPEILAATAALSPAKHDAYAPPCTYLSKPYPFTASR